MARSVWTGALSFGLLNIPIKLVTATRDRDIHFNMLHAKDGARIRSRRVCSIEGDEVPREEIVKGYKIGPDEYVRVDKEDLEAVEPEKSQTIDIQDFVDLADIDPIHFEKSYFLVPQEMGTKAYRILVDAMKDQGKVAVGRFVMRENEHLVAIRTKDDALMLERMRFAEEIVPTDVALEGVAVPKEATEKEVKMAEKLIDALATHFDPNEYHDEHRERVKEMLQRKMEGETITAPEAPPETEVTQDILKALEASLEKTKAEAS